MENKKAVKRIESHLQVLEAEGFEVMEQESGDGYYLVLVQWEIEE